MHRRSPLRNPTARVRRRTLCALVKAGRYDHSSPAPCRGRTGWTTTALPSRARRVDGELECDLAIVGGGFTGLWAALIAKERQPERDILLVEAEHVAFGATGRNGGFAEHSLTHGLSNGLMRFSEDELHELERVGAESFAELHASLARHGIDAHYEANGVLWIATEPYQVGEIDDEVELIRRFGGDAVALDGDAVRREVATPRALGGVWHRDGGGVLDPVALAYGLRRAVLELGVRICEGSPVARLREEPGASSSSAPAAACMRGASCSRPARTRRSCVPCGGACCRSTTTC